MEGSSRVKASLLMLLTLCSKLDMASEQTWLDHMPGKEIHELILNKIIESKRYPSLPKQKTNRPAQYTYSSAVRYESPYGMSPFDVCKAVWGGHYHGEPLIGGEHENRVMQEFVKLRDMNPWIRPTLEDTIVFNNMEDDPMRVLNALILRSKDISMKRLGE